MPAPDLSPVDAMVTLAAKLDEVSEMLEARYPDDDLRRTFTLVLILDFGMEQVRELWAKDHQREHGCEM